MRPYPRLSESGQNEDSEKDYGQMKMLMSITLVCPSFVVEVSANEKMRRQIRDIGIILPTLRVQLHQRL